MTIIAAQDQEHARTAVSVIMANFNGSAHLAAAIELVQTQTLRDIEIIVSDDASTDDSVDIVRRLMADDPRIHLLQSECNLGPAAARNRALDTAVGEWIAVVDSDDLIQPTRLATLVEFATRDGADIVADDLVIISSDEKVPRTRFLSGPWAAAPFWVDILDYLRLNQLYGSGPGLGYLKLLFHASIFREAECRYNEDLRNSEDYDLVLRLLHRGKRMRVYPLPLYIYRKHSNSSSHRLSESVLNALLACDRRFFDQIRPADVRLRAASAARVRSTAVALAYERLLTALKQRNYTAALTIAATNPNAAALLWMPIAARLRRITAGPPARASAARNKNTLLPVREHPRDAGPHANSPAPRTSQAEITPGEKAAQRRAVDDAVAVTVCICTFRRPSVIHAIKSVAAQQLPAGIPLEILVIDNDDKPSAKAMIDDYRTASGNDVRYLHAPGRNISIARNAALDAVRTPWLAFLDDDEQACPDWLQRLLSGRGEGQVVLGPVWAKYPANAPKWLSKADLLSTKPAPSPDGSIITGYSGNALIDMEFVRRHGLKFDAALGRTGGEDTIFFHALYRKGGSLRYMRDAVAYEYVAPSRVNLRWIAVRRYRAGQVYAMMFREFDTAKYRQVTLTAPLKIGACACLSCVFVSSSDRAMKWLMRGLFHLGTLSFALGQPIHEEYSSAGTLQSAPTDSVY